MERGKKKSHPSLFDSVLLDVFFQCNGRATSIERKKDEKSANGGK